ncbi:BON domain-containing protein [Aestuariicella hydrocarbonica]|uniref:BON domain-containing protein n=1 Tax=Pseudomaricurvus hydrocarbonicus TaxID=1470433 RepID=A0A9E5MQ53_9GAMM|nr:BON domain-containing protein [Aestuariicella hydrocarbonica]NHO68288.1 BON domain-containing protein [Aestuariicella hydrocarbonica]
MPTLKLIAFLTVLLASTFSWADKTAGDMVDDSVIQAEVKAKLVGKDFLAGMGVNIETHKGVVQLGGFVEDPAKAAQLAELAKSVEGVQKVDNQLHQRDPDRSAGQSMDDTLATTRIKAAISKADLGDGLKINIDTYNGVTLLTGFVATQEQKMRAGDLAKEDKNTQKVINGIYVMD